MSPEVGESESAPEVGESESAAATAGGSCRGSGSVTLAGVVDSGGESVGAVVLLHVLGDVRVVG